MIAGLVMVFFQIIIGGVTRLTGSGLSITKWEVVSGTLPPLNAKQWQEEFDLYKDTPQYKKINVGMSMKEFKFIYFWEFFHRLWARSIGFVFIIPFIFFLSRGWLDKKLIRQLLVLVGLGVVVAFFGWIMVKSGLNDRPWVSAYKLAMHLSLALVVFSYLLHIYLDYSGQKPVVRNTFLKGLSVFFLVLLAIQIIYGALMSGMHAGLTYPTWPKIGAHWLPPALFETTNYFAADFWKYENNTFVQLLVHFLHRGTAYLLLLTGVIMWWFSRTSGKLELIRVPLLWVSVLLLAQVILGIITVLSCKGEIPVFWGSVHQGTAILLLASAWVLNKKIASA
ncbi:MAG TPA: COX15/CtaA family protein [Saprospiraceae bacterium]|nr:COX15/CtaA family protein [Saprospiraceae bacterium]